MLDKPSVLAAYARKLKSSALTVEDAKRLKFMLYTCTELSEALPTLTTHPAAGFTIPYLDPDRKKTEFYRYRYLEQPAKNGFASLTKQKEIRYIQPALEKPRVYFSALQDWLAVFSKPVEQRWICITEGELKANCACKMGFPTIALGGVWNFMSKREGLPLIPDLAALPLKDCLVYIVYDSDAASNPEVLKAENALARQLLQKNQARPQVVRLPAIEGIAKTGLDDYLMHVGKAAFDKLITQAEEWEPSAALHELNEEVLMLRESAAVLELSTRHRWNAGEFVNAVYANRTYTATEQRKKDSVLVEKRTAAEWIKWNGRASVERITYRPGEVQVVDNEYNAWQGWGVKEEAVKKGDVSLWKQLLDYIFTGAQWEHRVWFEQWLAYPLRYPGTKLYQAVVIHGPAGTGKTLIAHTMSRIYGLNYTEVNERELHSGFNEWAEFKQFAFGDEITGGENKRNVADFLKGLITQKFLRVNPKYVRSYVVPDCMNWYFASNHADAFFMSNDDRRYMVQEIKQGPREREFYTAYSKWYKSEAGIAALFWYFLHLDLTGFDPEGHAPGSRDKTEMIDAGRSQMESWCNTLRHAPDEVLNAKDDEVNRRSLWTTRELYHIYSLAHGLNNKVTENGLAKGLKNAGLHKALDGAPVRTFAGLQKLWRVREVNGLHKPLDYAKRYKEERPREFEFWKLTHKEGKGDSI